MEFLTRNNPNGIYSAMDPHAAAQWQYLPSPSEYPSQRYPMGYFGHYNAPNYPYSPKSEDGLRNVTYRENSPFDLGHYQDSHLNFHPSESKGSFPSDHPNRTDAIANGHEDSIAVRNPFELVKKVAPPAFTPEESDSAIDFSPQPPPSYPDYTKRIEEDRSAIDFSPQPLPSYPDYTKRIEEDRRIVNNNYFTEASLSNQRHSLCSQKPADLSVSLPKFDLKFSIDKEAKDEASTETEPKIPGLFQLFMDRSNSPPEKEHKKRTSPPADEKDHFGAKGSPPESFLSGCSKSNSYDLTAEIAVGSDGAPIIFPWMKNKGGICTTNKRIRQQYTRQQTCQLEQEFRTNAYLTKFRRQQVADSLGLSERQIKIWFQNRRMKWKKTNKPLAPTLKRIDQDPCLWQKFSE